MEKEIKLPIGGAIVIPPHRTDLIAGAGLVYEDLGIDWTEYLPEGETQKVSGIDLYNCVSNGSVDGVGVQLNALFIEGLLSDNAKNFLLENGYIVDGKVNLAERPITVLSGTSPQWGNTWQNVADALRHWGVVPESKWSAEVKTVAEYYKDVPQSVKDLGLKFLEYFDVTYEIVAQGYPINKEVVEYHLKHAPLQVIGFVCSGWNTQIPVESCPPGGVQHCTMLYDTGSYKILDTYSPYLKTLSGDYYINFVGKIVIKEKGDNLVTRDNMNGVLYAITKKTNNDPDATNLAKALNIGNQTGVNTIMAKYIGSNKTLLQQIINYISSLIK